MRFLIDPKVEAKELQHLVKNLAGKCILVPNLKKMSFAKLSRKELENEIMKLHEGNSKKFKKIISVYKKIWKKHRKKYLKELSKILGYKLKDNKKSYIVPSLWVNIADVIGRKNSFFVAAKVQQNPLDFLLFHELTHLYYADALKKLNLKEALNTPLIEGVDHLILFKSPIKKLFKKPKYNEEPFVIDNSKFMKELEESWTKRKNFKSFLLEAIKIQGKNKNVKYNLK